MYSGKQGSLYAQHGEVCEHISRFCRQLQFDQTAGVFFCEFFELVFFYFKNFGRTKKIYVCVLAVTSTENIVGSDFKQHRLAALDQQVIADYETISGGMDINS